MGPVEFHLLKGPEVEVPRFMLRTQSGKSRAVFRSETRSEVFRAAQQHKERRLNGAERTLAKAACPKKGHGQTHATQQLPALFDHLVGAQQERLRYREAERLGSFEIHN